MRILIVGSGNTLRGDDGIGQRVVAEIGKRQWATAVDQLEATAVHQLLPELAEPISGAEVVIFVDAAVAGEPGRIVVRPVQPAPPQAGALTHHFDAAGLLGYARTLYGCSPRAYLVTITAASLGYAETLSPIVEGALPDVLRQIQALIDQEAQG